MITPRNILKHELIGLEVEVIDSTNKSQIGIKGIVVNETKNMIEIKTDRGVKKVQKKDCKFIFKIQGGKKVKVDGKKLKGRPEKRIKRKIKRWW